MPLPQLLKVIAHVAGVLLAIEAIMTSPAQAGLVWGVNGHPLVSYPGISFEAQLDYVRELGMTSYRVDISSTGKLADMDRLIRAASLRGITILPVVTSHFDLDNQAPQTLHDEAYALAFNLVSHFKGRLPVWELGNELENYAIIKPCEIQDDGKQYNCAWGPAGGTSALEYFGPRWAKVSAVIKGLTEGARAADPNVRRAVGSAGWGHVGAFERMQADGIEWEISVWHIYGEDPEWAFKKLAQYRRPIWVTEFNNPFGSQRGREDQAQGLAKAMSQLSALQATYDVEAAHIYELMDESYWGENFESYMGLVEMKKTAQGQWTAGDRKPAFDVVRRQIAGDTRGPLISRQCKMSPATNGEAFEPKVAASYAYCLVLGRAPDGAGLASYTSRLLDGMTDSQLLFELLNSDEFSARYHVSQLTAGEYATLLHRLLLDSDPDQSALKQMESEQDRNRLQQELIESHRFRALHPMLFSTAQMPDKPPAKVPQ